MSRYQIYVDQAPQGAKHKTMQKAGDAVNRQDIETGKDVLIYDTERSGYFKWFRVTLPRPNMREITSIEESEITFKPLAN